MPVFNTDIGGTLQAAVDAREVHRFLNSKRRFADWVKDKISEYEFEEDIDFIVIRYSQNSETKRKPGGNRRSIDYYLTLDTAKELSMVEKNAKGREARRYFIDCERRLHGQGGKCPGLPPQEGEAVPGAEDDFPPLSDLYYMSMLANRRALFLFCCQYVPFLSDPDLSITERMLRWQALAAYFDQIKDKMITGVDEVLNQTEGGWQVKKKAAATFVGKWYPPGWHLAKEGADDGQP